MNFLRIRTNLSCFYSYFLPQYLCLVWYVCVGRTCRQIDGGSWTFPCQPSQLLLLCTGQRTRSQKTLFPFLPSFVFHCIWVCPSFLSCSTSNLAEPEHDYPKGWDSQGWVRIPSRALGLLSYPFALVVWFSVSVCSLLSPCPVVYLYLFV